ncbi:hypothetical protein [Aureispira sp. CCB-E]|uniref:hypothetical protein n=1 Tax=Aureispira sp. CCB-E TaxID=3051121 RepID=UPI0028685D90|nr:hypothetical protein [Aureispira sp. CCB-E]WMX17117.1 hypothetical protein QP953_12105 [Aureispira sp. CCB-E]
MLKLIISVFFIFLFQNLYCQSRQIKKETNIKIDYLFKIYWQGKIRRDTFITEYLPDGSPKEWPTYLPPLSSIKFSTLDSTKIMVSSPNYIHKILYWSDSSTVNIYTKISQKSFCQINVQDKDTLQIREAYFKDKVNPKFNFEKIEVAIDEFNPFKVICNFEDSRLAKVFIQEKNGFTDSLKISIHPKKKNYEKFIFNDATNEWFLAEKVIFKKRKKIIWETDYHDYHKKYFTSNRVQHFNKYNNLVKEYTYDDFSLLIHESFYFYEYYKKK